MGRHKVFRDRHPDAAAATPYATDATTERVRRVAVVDGATTAAFQDRHRAHA